MMWGRHNHMPLKRYKKRAKSCHKKFSENECVFMVCIRKGIKKWIQQLDKVVKTVNEIELYI